LAASAIASILTFPLVSIDTAAVVAGGASYLKQLLERVEACAPVVLYFDELDKLFAASNESEEDIGSRQILGTLLTWLQELLEQREMMVPLYVRDTDRILALENRAKYICQLTGRQKQLGS
jgi:SpoVK/Ycf46/Vps4 family AAA+-type ATPase